MLCALKFYTDTRCVEMVRRQESRQTGAEIHTREVHTGKYSPPLIVETEGHLGVQEIRHGETRGVPQGGHIQGYPRALARGRST